MEKYNLGLTDKQPKTLEDVGVSLEWARPEDWNDYKTIRIEAIEQDPSAFDMNPKKIAEQKERLDDSWAKDLKEFPILLARRESKPVGVIKLVCKEEGVWLLNNVYVRPSLRKNITGAPIAEEMMKEVLKRIKDEGGNARLWVKASNKKAIKLYEEFGFKKFNPLKSLKRTMELTNNRPDQLVGLQIMELDLTEKDPSDKIENLKIEIKLAEQDDWQACKDLRLEAISLHPEIFGLTEEETQKEKDKSETEWREETSSDDMFSVLAYDGSKPVGLGRTKKIDNNSWFIRNGYVKKEFEKRGLHTKMIALRLLEIKKRKGIKVITGVKVDNDKSIKNLESFGFKRFPTDVGEAFYKMELDNLDSPELLKKINAVLDTR